MPPKRQKITEQELPLKMADVQRKVTRMGNITEVQACSNRNGKQYIEVLPDRKYIDLRTGEVKEFKTSETRADQAGSLRRTFKTLREIINANTEHPDNCRWVTLTYAENMTDPAQLYQDFRKYVQRLNYWCTKNGYDKPDYISVVEPQGRGAWHCHALLIWQSKAPYIANAKLAQIWGHGFVRITALEDCDNIGAYLTAYLADIPVEEAAPGQTGEIKEVNGKRYLKGGRLHMYPPGMNLFRTSKGIKRPEVEYLGPEDLDMSQLGRLTYRNTIKLQFDDDCETYIDTSYYNKRLK